MHSMFGKHCLESSSENPGYSKRIVISLKIAERTCSIPDFFKRFQKTTVIPIGISMIRQNILSILDWQYVLLRKLTRCMSVSVCRSHYQFVLGAGAKKNYDDLSRLQAGNNLPILFVALLVFFKIIFQRAI